MNEYRNAARYARLIARASNQTVIVSLSELSGWKLRHEDGSIPKAILDEILEQDSEKQETEYIHSETDGPNAEYYRDKKLVEDGTDGLKQSH